MLSHKRVVQLLCTLLLIPCGIGTAAASVLHLKAPSLVRGGTTVTGRIQINRPAPTGGETVTLTSSDPAVTVPASVTIPAGRTHAEFQIVTTAVAADTTVTIAATDGTLTASDMLVVEAPDLAEIGVRPERVRGGDSAMGSVSLTAPAGAGGLTIQLSSDNPAVSVPASVTVLAGHREATFPITTTAVSQSVVVTITATVNGVTKTVQLMLR